MWLIVASWLTDLKEFIDIIQGVTVTLAAIIGGWWALNRYRRERTAEAAIDISIEFSSTPHGPEHLAFFDVCLANKGKTRIQAKADRPNGLAYDDGPERLRHSASLQVRKIQPWVTPQRRHIDWFEPYL